MRTHGPQPVGVSRFLVSARLRRALIYLLAVASVAGAGLLAVRLASPPDHHGRIRVERLPGASPEPGRTETQVGYDSRTDRTTIIVRNEDGTVRRYYVEEADGEWRIEADPGSPP